MTVSTDIQRLLDDLRVDLPGVVVSSLQAATLSVLDEFLDFTNVWYEDIDFTLTVGNTAYLLNTPTQGRIVRLLIVYDPQANTGPSLQWADNVELVLPGTLRVATTPSQTAVRTARVAKKVSATYDADGWPDTPDWIIQRYREQLREGVLSRLMLSPGKPWTSIPLAQFYGKKFLSSKTIARIDAIKGNVRGQTNWAYPSTYSSNTQRGA